MSRVSPFKSTAACIGGSSRLPARPALHAGATGVILGEEAGVSECTPRAHGQVSGTITVVDWPAMKILLVSPFDFGVRGGVNEHIVQLDWQFRYLGHETRILAATSGDIGEVDDGHVYMLGTALPLPSNGSQARITLSPFTLNKVRHFLEREQFDVIHMHEPLVPMLPLACLLYSKALNVGTFHAARTTNLWYLYTKALLDMFFVRLDRRIAVSNAARDFADNHFPGEYEVVPNGIDLERFSGDIRPIPQYNDGRKNILFVGRYNESRKGFRHLVRALPAIRTQFPDARLLVVGPGNRERYERLLEQHDIRDVVFVGSVDDKTKARYYATCDVFCAPSTGRESFGIILLEALASGKPVVASDIPGYAGVIHHGDTGMLVEPKNPQSLALAIVRVLADTELREKLRINGLKHVKQYSWTNVARKVLDVYECGLQEGPPPRATQSVPELLVGRDG